LEPYSKKGLASLTPGRPGNARHVPLSGTEPTFANGILCMTRYTFRIRQGSHASDVHVNLWDDDAAWDEAAAACSDMIRDTTDRLRASPEWRLEVIDESGAVRHLIRLTAESFD
jgi:hypothetical protein